MIGLNSNTYTNNQPFNNSQLIKNLKLDKDEKQEFEQRIGSITATQVISSDTIGLQATQGITQIYVYQIVLKGSCNTVPYSTIKALDKITQIHTIFEIIDASEQYTYTLANKTFGEKGVSIGDYASRITTGEYAPPQDYPLVDIADIYRLVTAFVLDLTLKNDIIDVGCLWERHKERQQLDKQLQGLKVKIEKENNPRKRIEYNEQLAKLQTEKEKY